MRLSPAPNNYPSGLRPVAAAGAGVQFATGPCLTSWVNEGSVGLGSGGLTMQSRNRQGGSVAFNFRGWSWLGHAEHCKAGNGAVWRNVTPRNGGNFSGLAIASPGWAQQCSTGRGNSATRGDIAGQFSRGVACQDTARLVPAKRELGAASKRNFTRPCVARRGGSGPGAATTSPGTAIPDIFPSTKKLLHHAGQRSTG